MHPQAHLLKIPLETRGGIYGCIVKDIQSKRPTLFGNPVSEYEGLRLVCKQLHEETQKWVFFSSFTSHQIEQISLLRPNKSTFQNVRSISVEIPFSLGRDQYRHLSTFLECMQLSVQELRIFFIGKDQRGNETKIWGCGKKKFQTNTKNIALLKDEGQDFENQWELLRRIAILRNLRVLQLENANIPVSQGLMYSNKPFLQAVSVTSDPRSVASSLSRMSNLKRGHLYRNISIRPQRFPPVKVLTLDMNSASNVEGIVNGVDETLRQLSLRIPTPDLQPHGYNEKCSYGITDRLMHTMSYRATKLESLRLCISGRDCFSHHRSDIDADRATVELADRLPLFRALKHLEIHFDGDCDFFKNGLIARLPPGLSRLYISDHTLSISRLVQQVRKRYFTYVEDDQEEANNAVDMLSNSPSGAVIPLRSIRINEQDFKADSFYDKVLVGEMKSRRDDTPLSGGNLGFIDYEYTCAGHDNACVPSDREEIDSEWTYMDVIKLNGQLLDREHHFGLNYVQRYGAPYGIAPRQEEPAAVHSSAEHPETATYSCHSGIYLALYDLAETAPKPHVTEKNRQIFKECFGDDDHWYFGSEDEAMKVFNREPVAKIENQRQKPMIVDVEVPDSDRCRWASPDIQLSPVGSFPVPELPFDWKDYV